MRPAVVVLAYDRPLALQRLLDSIARARFPDNDVALVISIDAGGANAVRTVAETFAWAHGEKRVHARDRHLGVVGHFQMAGDLTEEFDSIVLLEDDQVVSASFYEYASGALGFYRDDDRVAGISLYSLWFNGYNHFPFEPLLDDSDVFFLQIPFFAGQAFTWKQWAGYRAWRAQADTRPDPRDPLHPSLLRFDPDDWFPERIKFLSSTERYYVFPRESVCLAWGDAGTHFKRPTRWFQVPLQHLRSTWRFGPFEQSSAVYDSFFEILPDRLRRLAPDLPEGFDVDLYATKPRHALAKELVLTSRRSRVPLAGYARDLRPMEANVIRRVAGDAIALSSPDDVRWGRWDDLVVRERLHDHFSRGRSLSIRVGLAFGVLRRIRKAMRWIRNGAISGR